jgi:hypothetical protein
MTQVVEVIRKRLAEIDAQLTSLQRERGTLERALADLDGSGETGTSAARNRRVRQARPGLRKRAPRGQRRQQVLEHLDKRPGARPAEIAQSIDVSNSQVSGLIAELRKEKLVVKRGKGYALKSAAK